VPPRCERFKVVTNWPGVLNKEDRSSAPSHPQGQTIDPLDDSKKVVLRRAVGLVWPKAAVQRCCVHKLRNLERKAPKHALADIRDDFHRIVYAANADTARTAYAAFERTWKKRCPGVVTSLREGGDELLTFFRYPKTQWKTLRTTNTTERLHEEFRRRVKTQNSLPTEDAALVLLFSLVASEQIKLRKIDGWQKIGAVLNQHTAVAA
jgi:putative transposase